MRPSDNDGVKIAFTATRSVPRNRYDFIREEVRKLSRLDPIEFTSGCAVGGDTIIAVAAYTNFPDAIHRLVVPRDKHNHLLVKNFRELQIKDPEHIRIELCPEGPASRPPLLFRNDYMLAISEILCAFPKTTQEEMRGSGTWACIRQAQRTNVPILYYPVWRGDPWTEI